MKKLLTAITAATLVATAAFAAPFGVSDADLRLSGRIQFEGETLHVPGYYEWLVEKKGGVENAGAWRLRKLSYILEQVNDQKKPHFGDVCYHIISTGDIPKQLQGNCN